MNETYLRTAELLVRVAPIVLHGDRLALKGGTAINLFVRDMPRLSVDLDVVLVDGTLPREAALAAISGHLRDAAVRLARSGFEVKTRAISTGDEARIDVRQGGFAVKVEVNHVMRGTLLAVRTVRMCASARRALLADATLPLLDEAEIYGSKLVAALDRQHPRDLFDVAQLYRHGGITPTIRRCFVAYLACHNRPVHEVLFAPEKDVQRMYDDEFVGMTAEEIPLDELNAARTRLLRELPASLDDDERAFLRSLVRAEPDFGRLGIAHVAVLPAIRWKVENLRKLRESNRRKFDEQGDTLDRLLENPQ